MPNSQKILATTLSVFAVLAASAAPAAAAPPAPSRSLSGNDCFRAADWDAWKSPSPDVLYLKLRNNSVYRVDLLNNGQPLDSVGKLLVSRVRGSGTVCAPVDLDLKLADRSGFVTPLFPTGIAKLTQAQIAALPANARP